MVASRLGPQDLVITSSTLGHPPFPELVAAAAGAGVRGLSLWPEPDFGHALAAGSSVAELRSVLDDHDVVVNDVDAIVEWAGPDDPGPQYFEEPPRRLLYEAADALGARLANVLLIGPKGVALDDLAAAFARVCDEAAEHGLVGTLEFSAGTHAPDLNTARRIVETAGRPNGAILVDAWHLHLGRTTLDDLAALPGSLVAAVQLNDGPAERPADFAARDASTRASRPATARSTCPRSWAPSTPSGAPPRSGSRCSTLRCSRSSDRSRWRAVSPAPSAGSGPDRAATGGVRHGCGEDADEHVDEAVGDRARSGALAVDPELDLPVGLAEQAVGEILADGETLESDVVGQVRGDPLERAQAALRVRVVDVDDERDQLGVAAQRSQERDVVAPALAFGDQLGGRLHDRGLHDVAELDRSAAPRAG